MTANLPDPSDVWSAALLRCWTDAQKDRERDERHRQAETDRLEESEKEEAP